MQLNNFGLQYNDVGGKNLEKSSTSTIALSPSLTNRYLPCFPNDLGNMIQAQQVSSAL